MAASGRPVIVPCAEAGTGSTAPMISQGATPQATVRRRRRDSGRTMSVLRDVEGLRAGRPNEDAVDGRGDVALDVRLYEVHIFARVQEDCRVVGEELALRLPVDLVSFGRLE